MGFFSKLRSKDKDGGGLTTPRSKKKANAHTNGVVIPVPPPKPRWEGDAWTRKEVEPEEIQELLRGCTNELKSRALDMPFLLLPFRPASDPSAARTFIRNFFSMERGIELKGERLEQELMLTEPMVCNISEQLVPISERALCHGCKISFRSNRLSKLIWDVFMLGFSCLKGMLTRT